MKIAVLDDWHGVAPKMADWDRLGASIDFFTGVLENPAQQLQGYNVICLMRERTPFPADLINALPDLRLIVTTGPRNLSIDVAAARERGIEVCGTRSLKTTTSELSLALILALSRQIIPEARGFEQGGWQQVLGRDLAGLRLGVVGLGNIGRQLAAMGALLGMQVSAWSPNLTQERCDEAGVGFVPTLMDLAAQSDVLSLHMVLSDKSRGLIGAEVFSALPKDAIFVNTSRAGLIDRDGLFTAMRANPTLRAAIDVYETEPVPADDPWRAAKAEFADRLLLTPHLGYVTRSTWQIFYTETVEAIEAWVKGTPIRCL